MKRGQQWQISLEHLSKWMFSITTNWLSFMIINSPQWFVQTYFLFTRAVRSSRLTLVFKKGTITEPSTRWVVHATPVIGSLAVFTRHLSFISGLTSFTKPITCDKICKKFCEKFANKYVTVIKLVLLAILAGLLKFLGNESWMSHWWVIWRSFNHKFVIRAD